MGRRPRSSTAAEFRTSCGLKSTAGRRSSRAPGPGRMRCSDRTGSTRLARETRHQRVLDNGFSFHRSEWMQSGRGPGLSPTVFLGTAAAPCSPRTSIRTTSSRSSRAAPARWDCTPWVPGPHYAGAFTGYGPWWRMAGLSYFTIRAGYETGARSPAVGAGQVAARTETTCARTCASSTAGRSAARPGIGMPGPTVAPQDDLEAYALRLPPRALLEPDELGGSGSSSLSCRNACHATGPAAGLGKPLPVARRRRRMRGRRKRTAPAGAADARARARIRRCMKRPQSPV